LAKKRKVTAKPKKRVASLRKEGKKGMVARKKIVRMKKEMEKKIVQDNKIDQVNQIDKKVLSRLRKILLKEREEIVGEVKQTYASSQEVGQDGIQDIGDEAANIYNKQILLSLNENERIRLQEVDDALDRMASGTYGICEECGEPISLKRLEVQPVAKYCVACLSKMEKGRL